MSGLTFLLTPLVALAYAAPIASEGATSKRDCLYAGCRFSNAVSMDWRLTKCVMD